MDDVMMSKPIIAVWFSCGAASAVAAKLTLEKYRHSHDVRVLNNPVKEEGLDNQRFMLDVVEWINHPIELVTSPEWPDASAQILWEKERYMSGIKGAACTRGLKKQAREHWERTNIVQWHVLGFTADERKRFDRFVLTERSNVLPILIDANVTKQGCIDIIQQAGIRLPQAYIDGFNNANCKGCIKAESPTYWNLTREVYPEVFAERAALSRDLGVKLARVKGKRVFLDELDPNAKGRPMKRLVSPDCGNFCEEYQKPKRTVK